MKVTVYLSVLLCSLLGVNSLIIPDELPSILSVIYSNIPTLKKGTDSRLGWGFRLGDRADFQIMVELGPQQYTQPLRNQKSKDANKRQTIGTLTDTLYAQNQELKRQKAQSQKQQHQIHVQKQEQQRKHSNKKEINPVPNSEAAAYLTAWSASTKKQQRAHATVKARPGLGIGEIDAKSVIPEDYDDHNRRTHQRPIHNKPITTTSKADALDNVDLD